MSAIVITPRLVLNALLTDMKGLSLSYEASEYLRVRDLVVLA